MKLRDIFDTLSKRWSKEHPVITPHPVSAKVRNNILHLCSDMFYGRHDYGVEISEYDSEEYWTEVNSKLLYQIGERRLIPGATYHTIQEETEQYLLNCSDMSFLDFIEIIFKTQAISRVCVDANVFVDDINAILGQEDTGYELTKAVSETTYVYSHGYRSRYTSKSLSTIKIFPQIILREDSIVHDTVIAPTLNLLQELRFLNANKEYLNAMDSYRNSDYGNCIGMCCSAFESVLKVICPSCSHDANASQLIKAVMGLYKLEPFFEPSLMTVATLRNKLSPFHGAGREEKSITKAKARYSLNMCASAILLLVEESSDHQ